MTGVSDGRLTCVRLRLGAASCGTTIGTRPTSCAMKALFSTCGKCLRWGVRCETVLSPSHARSRAIKPGTQDQQDLSLAKSEVPTARLRSIARLVALTLTQSPPAADTCHGSSPTHPMDSSHATLRVGPCLSKATRQEISPEDPSVHEREAREYPFCPCPNPKDAATRNLSHVSAPASSWSCSGLLGRGL